MANLFRNIFQEYSEITVRYDLNQEAVWSYLNPQQRPCISPEMLSQARTIQKAIVEYCLSDQTDDHYPIKYIVLASQVNGVFSFGGDLNLFIQLINAKKQDQLLRYAKNCIDVCYMNAVCMQLPITTISLVQGSALGGGFESALSTHVIIAEEHAQFGVPEIRFNLFPGMGAYSFLTRKAGAHTAEKILTSGQIYSAQEMHEMDIVDVVVPTGSGYEAVNHYIKRHRRSANGLQAIQAVKQFCNPVTYEELMGITKIWVKAALGLSRKDLRVMEKLVAAQNRGKFHTIASDSDGQRLRTIQDRRIGSDNVTFPLVDGSGKELQTDRRGLDRRGAGELQVSNY